MIRWCSRPYYGEKISEKTDAADAVRRASENLDVPGRYQVLMLSPNGKDLLDIRPLKDLSRSFLKEKDLLIAGVAYNRKEALELVEQIASDCFREREDADIRAFLME